MNLNNPCVLFNAVNSVLNVNDVCLEDFGRKSLFQVFLIIYLPSISHCLTSPTDVVPFLHSVHGSLIELIPILLTGQVPRYFKHAVIHTQETKVRHYTYS